MRRIAGCLTLPIAAILLGAHLPPERLVLRLDAPGPSFRPNEALGAAIDGTERGGVDRILTPHNVAAMRGAGLRPLTYRLKTELGIEAWHWNPAGSWSDPAHHQGYWTSSDTLGKPIRLSWGYRLPRRGDTTDQAGDRGYSRLTDGDPATFWKSNPYLDPRALHDGVAHPQWAVLRFDKRRPIDSTVIDWGTPYATHYEVQYWTGTNEDDGDGRWVTFPNGRVTDGHGGRVELRLTAQPVETSHVRVLLEQASGAAPAASTDWRDAAGYAIRELSFGVREENGAFADAVVHAPSNVAQTWAHVSSTDPWHRAVDRDPELEQPGLDRVFTSKLNFGEPLMIPTGLFYDTPDNARAELTYITRRHYKVARVELGEEPDGQYISAADYGALYLAAFDRVDGILPHVPIGGPSLQSAFTDTWMQPDAPHKWDGWLAEYLRRRGRLSAMQFVSFEFYPFDDICGDMAPKLVEQDDLLSQAWAQLDSDGWPRATPRIISEYGFSAYSGRAESQLTSALLTADIAGQWLSLGGKAAYLFGYPPNWPATDTQACAGYGNMMLFEGDHAGQAHQPMPEYFAARLLTHAWTKPGGGVHRIVPATLEGATDGDVVAFAVRRRDGRIAIMLVNRNAHDAHAVALLSRLGNGAETPLSGPANVFSYGPAQYMWIDQGQRSHPGRDLPPVRRKSGRGPLKLELGPSSIAVVVFDPRS